MDDCQNEHRDQCFAEGEWVTAGWITFTASSMAHGTLVQGYEGSGPQKVDAKDASDGICDMITDMAQRILREEQGRDVDHAISALHGQHTRNGRPSRFMPETE